MDSGITTQLFHFGATMKLNLLLAFAVVSLAGCASSARYVARTATDGTVAVPDSTNSWPSYHHDQAVKLIEKHVGDEYDIITEEEYVKGHKTSNDKNVEEQNRFSIFFWRPRVVEHTETTQTKTDLTEWRIHYRRRMN
jgi:hypothetical protein